MEKSGKYPYKRIYLGLILWVFTSTLLLAEVSLKKVAVESGVSGEWTNLNVAFKNDGSEPKDVRLELVSGELDSGLSSVFWDFSIPPFCEWERSLPFLMPERKVNAKPTSAKKNNKAPTSMSDRSFSVEVKFFVEGSIKKRDNIMGNYLTENVLNVMVEKSLLEQSYPPTDPRGTLLENSSIELPKFKFLGKNSKFRFHSFKSSGNNFLTATKLSSQSIIVMPVGPLCTGEITVLQQWVEQGGLLILHSLNTQEQDLHRVYNFSPTRESFFYPKLEKAQGFLVSGMQHLFSESWQSILDHDGVCMGASRKQGLGKVLVLNMPVGLLQKINEKWTIDCIQRNLPEKLKDLIQYGDGAKETQAQLSKLSGRVVWSKTKVITFLFSCVIMVFLLSFLPFFKTRREWRWALWMTMVFVWTLVGLVIHLLSVDRSTRLTTFSWVMRSPEFQRVQEWGMASFISGEKRRFPLNFKDGVTWNLKGNGLHHEKEMSPKGLNWSNFSLAPQIEQKINWNSVYDDPVLFKGPQIVLGEHWECSTPQEWKGEKCLLVMGRRSWTVIGGTVTPLSKDPSSQMDPLNQWPLVKSFISSEKECFNPYNRVWLFREIPQVANPFSLPHDITISGKTMECWSIVPEIKFYPVNLYAGTEDWSFIRAGEERREDASFNGLELDSNFHSVDLQLQMPNWAESLMVSEFSLVFKDSIDPMMWKLSYLNKDRQEKNIRILNKVASLPQDAWWDEHLILNIKSKSLTSDKKVVKEELSTHQGFPLLGLQAIGVQRD